MIVMNGSISNAVLINANILGCLIVETQAFCLKANPWITEDN